MRARTSSALFPPQTIGLVAFVLGPAFEPRAAAQPVPTCFGTRPTILGTPRNDRLKGPAGDAVIVALGGDDVLAGHDGDDVLMGGWGSDTLVGGDGDDVLDGNRQRNETHGGPGTDVCLNAVRKVRCERSPATEVLSSPGRSAWRDP